jgi:DNA-directed RNA polymerase II subunit RPB2
MSLDSKDMKVSKFKKSSKNGSKSKVNRSKKSVETDSDKLSALEHEDGSTNNLENNVLAITKKINKSHAIKNYEGSKSSSVDNVNNLNVDDIFKFMDLYFNNNGVMYNHLYNSYNKMLDENLANFLERGEHVFYEKVTKDQIIKYKFKYEKVSIKEPKLGNTDEPMFPSDARNRNLTYGSKLVAKVTQLQEIIDIATDDRTIREIGLPVEDQPIAFLPIMVKSKYCSLNVHKGHDKSECSYDPGGYFIVNGSEKVIISQDRMCENKPLVFIRKQSGVELYTVQVNSKSYNPHGLTQVLTVQLRKDGVLTIKVPILSEIPVFILFRALGIESDKDIISSIVYDLKDNKMVDLLRASMENCKSEKGMNIQTKEDAIEYLKSKIRVIKKYSETDKKVKEIQKRMHLMSLLENSFLPHIEGSLYEKGMFLGYMINRLMRCVLGRIAKDDRDSYVNKRVDLPGNLLEELFRQYYRKMLKECEKFFKKRNPSDTEPMNIINQIKPNIIEQGLKAALLTGSWIRRKGVAQMLQRLTWLQTISFLRRIDSPGGDASTSKLTSPRHLHPSSSGLLCPTSTPEHAKVGLTKHLTIVSSISILQSSQITIIKSFLKKKVINLRDVEIDKIKNSTKVFLNGEPLGLTNDAHALYTEVHNNKLNGTFSPIISVIYDAKEREIRVYCDGGRIFKPTIVVEDNIIKLTRDHINSTSLNRADKTKITSWEEFMIKNPGIIEYVDMEEYPYLMMSEGAKHVEKMRQTMVNSIDKVKDVKSNNVDNRYNDMLYVKYTHCDFHPSFLLAEIVTNIPFCNSNQGPRNIFQYSQGRQAMGIYVTNYRDRLDISYILYHTQKPLVSTRTSKYMHNDILACGENAMVAIATYTGLSD